jgi:hypothetical protein
MIQHKFTERATHRLVQRLRWARLPIPACLEDLDTRTPRGIDRAQLAQVTDLHWIREHLNVLITGPPGVGKSYLGAALAHAACRADFSVRCFRLPRLIEELARYAAMQRRSALFRQLAKADLLVLDDFGLAPLSDETVRDLLEISTIDTSGAQLSSPASFRSISGTPTWVTEPSPMPSSIGSSTTAIGWSSRASLCADTEPSRPNRPLQNQKTIDPDNLLTQRAITASHPGRHHPDRWSGIRRNRGPSSPEYACRRHSKRRSARILPASYYSKCSR